MKKSVNCIVMKKSISVLLGDSSIKEEERRTRKKSRKKKDNYK